MPAFILEKLCRGCQRCVHACPEKAIKMVAHMAVVDEEKCMECEECMEACMQGAITFKTNGQEVLANG
jgi:ferredoxin